MRCHYQTPFYSDLEDNFPILPLKLLFLGLCYIICCFVFDKLLKNCMSESQTSWRQKKMHFIFQNTGCMDISKKICIKCIFIILHHSYHFHTSRLITKKVSSMHKLFRNFFLPSFPILKMSTGKGICACVYIQINIYRYKYRQLVDAYSLYVPGSWNLTWKFFPLLPDQQPPAAYFPSPLEYHPYCKTKWACFLSHILNCGI